MHLEGQHASALVVAEHAHGEAERSSELHHQDVLTELRLDVERAAVGSGEAARADLEAASARLVSQWHRRLEVAEVEHERISHDAQPGHAAVRVAAERAAEAASVLARELTDLRRVHETQLAAARAAAGRLAVSRVGVVDEPDRPPRRVAPTSPLPASAPTGPGGPVATPMATAAPGADETALNRRSSGLARPGHGTRQAPRPLETSATAPPTDMPRGPVRSNGANGADGTNGWNRADNDHADRRRSARRDGDELQRIDGVDLRIHTALAAAGITTFVRLQAASPDELRDALASAGLMFPDSLPSWAAQAAGMLHAATGADHDSVTIDLTGDLTADHPIAPRR